MVTDKCAVLEEYIYVGGTSIQKVKILNIIIIFLLQNLRSREHQSETYHLLIMLTDVETLLLKQIYFVSF